MKSFSSVPDSSVTVSEAEIKSYYSSHKSNFKKSAQRDLEYVHLILFLQQMIIKVPLII